MNLLGRLDTRSGVRFTKIEGPYVYSPDDLLITSIFLTAFLLPIYIVSAGRFGFKVLILLGSCCGTAFFLEYVGSWISKKRIRYFGISTWVLYPLLAPPGMPLWTILLCLVLSITITQIFFGGFGFHVFHPAVAGQVFLMINFLNLYNNSYVQPFENPFFGFYSYATMSFTNETTLLMLEKGTEISTMQLFMGPNVGTYAAIFPYLIIVAGTLYLYFGRINRLTPLIYGISLLFFSYLGSLLFPNRILSMIPTILAGDALFYLFFIFSDRLTSPRTRKSRLIAGIFAGFLTVLIRSFSINNEGVMFAAMFNYAFTPLYDELIFSIQRKREKVYEKAES